MKVAVTGSSGLIGTALAAWLRGAGHEVRLLVRHAPRGPDEADWRPRGPDADAAALGGADAVVNLAGAPLTAGRWTQARKQEIRASRVEGTERLAAALAALRPRPAVLLSGSAIGWYGNTGDRPVTESAPSGSGFLAGVVRDWEAATGAAAAAGIRVVHLRTGLVLAARGGLLGRLAPLFRLGLGARFSTGAQYMSWITLTDVVAAIGFLMAREEVAGPVNLVAPEAVTNAEFTAALAAAVHRPAVLRIPAPVLRLALGEAASEVLSSARVVPGRLTEAGFEYRYPSLRPALAALAALATELS